MKLIILTIAALALAMPAHSKIKRSHKVVALFKAQNPCPDTGIIQRRCVGYIIDHIEPLCAGGEDSVDNLQWQTVAAAKAKDVLERRQCAALKKKWRNE